MKLEVILVTPSPPHPFRRFRCSKKRSPFHALLDPDTARATQQQLTDEQRARNLFFGERPLMSVLRQRHRPANRCALIQRACGLVAGALNAWRARCSKKRRCEPIWR